MEEKKVNIVSAWIEAMRLRTLPVSTAGVLCAWALALHFSSEIRWLPAVICLVFAVLCQIASNFANEYYDYLDGLDRCGRSGPRRGVTEGDITPDAMKTATFTVLCIAMLAGLSLLYWGGAWLLIVGVTIALGALAYSAGPYPLSRHGLGEVAVLVFFGIVPVNFTYYLSTGSWCPQVLLYSISIGLMGANVLIVNNYRDADEDEAVGKRTLANIMGRQRTRMLYLLNGIVAFALSVMAVANGNKMWIASVVYILLHLFVWTKLRLSEGQSPSALNPLLGMTACVMLVFAALCFI